MARRNPFPGVGNSPTIDRHGKKRWRLRKTVKGRKIDTYLPGPFGSVDFRKAYDEAINPPKSQQSLTYTPGTFDYVITAYLNGRHFKGLANSTRRGKRKRLDWIRGLIGSAELSDLKPYHLENIMERKGGPWAADRLHKDIGEIYRFATRTLGFNGPHPTDKVSRSNLPTNGHHTWMADQVKQFRDHHASGTLARLAFELILGTGAARQDACAMGRQNIKGTDIWYRRGKTGQDVTLPLGKLPELCNELRQTSPTKAQFFDYTTESFGNWFRDQCEAAGLPKVCRAHGLRKHGAARLAERGATEFQIMAFLAHKTPYEARKYVAGANRVKLASDALAHLETTELTNLSRWLDKSGNQPAEKKGKK